MEVDNSEEDPSGASEVTAIQNIKTLYIPDLPDELLDSKLLHEHFSQFGEVVRVNVSKKRKNTLIHFLDHVTARKAKRNGGEIKGFKLHIFWSASKKMDSSSQNKNPRPALNRNPADASEKPPDPSTRHRSALLRNLPSEKQTEEYEKSIPVNVRRQKTFKKARKHRSALLKHLPEEEGEEERTMKKHVPVASTSLPELQGIEDSDSGVVNPNPFVCSSEPALLGRGDTDSGLVNLFAVPSKTESVNPFTTVKTTTAQTVHTPFTSTLTATTSTANPFFVLNSPASSSHPGNPFLKSTFEIPLTDASQRQISPFFTSVMTAPTSSHSQRPFGSFPGSTLTVPAFSQARPVTPFFTSGLTAFTTSPATTVNPFTTNTFTATATTSPTMTVNPFTKSAITPVCTSTSVRLSSPFATNAFAVTNTSSSAKTVGPFVMSAFTSTATANPVQAVSHFTSNTFAATGTGSPSPDKPLTTPTPSSGASSSFKFTTHDAHNPLIPHIPPTTSSGFSSCFKFTTRDASTKHRSILLKRAAACSSESSPESSPRPTYGHSSGNHPIRSRVPDKKSKNVSSDSSPESNKKKVVTPHRPSRSTHISRSTHVPKELTSFDKALKLQKRSKELREMREQRESRGSRELRGSKDLRKGREVLKISLSSSKISDVPDEVRDELEALAEIPEYEKCQSVLNDEVFKIPSPKKFIVRSKIRTPVKKSQLIEQAASPAAEEKRKRRRSAVDEAVWKALMDMWDSKVNKAFETAEERYQILELRDKILRARRGKQSNVSQDVVAGTCPDMCPEKERYQRESRQQIALYEYRQGSYQEALCMDHSLAVKQYSRSSADQEEPLPHELRPAKELRMTMDYLLAKIVNRIDNKKENIAEWYQFLWDRTRGIRKDITQQDLCDMDAVCMLEECVRFHVYCSERLVSEGPNVFDHKINSENLTKCLQTLKYLYKDMYLKNVNCPNEPEFRAYIILLNLNDGNFMWELKKLRLEIINSEPVQFAIAIYHALSTNNYVRFFKLVKQTTFLNACILLRYFYQVRHKAMRIIVKSHSTGLTKKAVIPLGELERILCFESLREAAVFCDHLGLTITDVNPNTLVFREHMSYTPRRLSDSRAIKLIESKQKMSVGQTIRGGLPLETSSFEKHIVTSSFNLDGTLKKEVITQIKEHVEYQECSSKLDEMDTTENMEQESIDLGIRIERDIERLHEAKDEPKPEPMVAPVIPEIENVAPTPHEQQKSEDEKSVDSFEEMFGEISEEEVDVFLERLQNVALLEYDEMLLDVSCSMVRDTFRQVLAEEKEKIHKQEEEKRKKEELVQQRKIEEEQLKKLEMERQKQVEKERKEAEEHQRRLAEQKRMEEAKRKQEEKLQQAEAVIQVIAEDLEKFCKFEKEKHKMEEVEQHEKMEEEQQIKIEEVQQKKIEEEQQKKLEEEQQKKLEVERQKQIEKERKDADEHQRRLAEQKSQEEECQKQKEKLQLLQVTERDAEEYKRRLTEQKIQEEECQKQKEKLQLLQVNERDAEEDQRQLAEQKSQEEECQKQKEKLQLLQVTERDAEEYKRRLTEQRIQEEECQKQKEELQLLQVNERDAEERQRRLSEQKRQEEECQKPEEKLQLLQVTEIDAKEHQRQLAEQKRQEDECQKQDEKLQLLQVTERDAKEHQRQLAKQKRQEEECQKREEKLQLLKVTERDGEEHQRRLAEEKRQEEECQKQEDKLQLLQVTERDAEEHQRRLAEQKRQEEEGQKQGEKRQLLQVIQRYSEEFQRRLAEQKRQEEECQKQDEKLQLLQVTERDAEEHQRRLVEQKRQEEEWQKHEEKLQLLQVTGRDAEERQRRLAEQKRQEEEWQKQKEKLQLLQVIQRYSEECQRRLAEQKRQEEECQKQEEKRQLLQVTERDAEEHQRRSAEQKRQGEECQNQEEKLQLLQVTERDAEELQRQLAEQKRQEEECQKQEEELQLLQVTQRDAEEHQRRLAEQKRQEEECQKLEEKLQLLHLTERDANQLTDSVTEDVVKEMAEEVTTEEIELHNSCLETMDMVVDETVHEYSYSVVEEVCLESKVQYVMQKRQEGITRKYFNLWRDIVQKRQSRRRALEFPAWFTPLTSPEGFTGLPEVEPIWKKDRLEKVEIPPDLNHYAKMIPLWDLLALELFLNSPFKRICYKNYKLMFSIPDVNECPRWAPVLDLYMDVAFPKTEEGPMENGPAIFIRQILNANDGALRVLTVSAWRIHGSHLQDAEKKSRGMDALLFVYGNDADPAVSLKRLENFIGSMENYRGVSLAIVVTRNMDEKELEKILHLDELKERIQKPINVKFFFRESTYTGLHIAMASAVTWLSKTHESIERHPPYFTSPVLLMRTSLMNSLWDKFLSVESVPFEDNRMKLNLSQVVSIYNKACDELLDMVLDKDINETGFGAPEFEQFVKTPVVGFITYFVVPERYKTDEFKDMVTKIFTRAKFIAPSNEVIRNRVDLFNFVQTVCQQNELDQAVHMKICMYICQQTVKNQHPLLVDWCWAVKHSFSWIEVFKIMVQEKMTRLFSEIDPKLTVGLKAERIRDFEERQYRSFRLDYLCNEAEKSQEVVDPPVPELPTNVKRNLLYEPLPEVKRFKPDIETPYPSEESKHETSAEEEKALIEKNRKAMESLEATSAECEASMKAAIEQLQTIYEQEGLDYPDGTPSASAGTHPMTPYEEIRYYMGLPPPVFPNIVVPPVIPRIRTESEEPKMKPKTYLMQFGTSYRNVDINLTFEERLQCRNYTDMYLRNIEKGIELADNSIAEVLEDNEQLRSPSLSNTGEAVENVLTTRISHTQGAMQQQQRTCISQIEKTVEGLPSKSLSHTRETVEHPGTFHTRESVTKSLFLTRESVEECSSIFSSDSKKQVKQFPSSYASLTSEAMEWIPTESISHTREAVEESPSSDISYIGETLKGLRSRSMSSPKHDLESEGTYRSCTSGSSESTYVSCTSESTKRLSTKVISDTKKSLGEHTSTYIPSSIEAMEQLPTKVSCYEDITSSSEDEFFEPCNDF